MRIAFSTVCITCIRALGILIGLYLCLMGSTALMIDFTTEHSAALGGILEITLGTLLLLPWRWIRTRALWWPLFIGLTAFPSVIALSLFVMVVGHLFWPDAFDYLGWGILIASIVVAFLVAQVWAVWRLHRNYVPIALHPTLQA